LLSRLRSGKHPLSKRKNQRKISLHHYFPPKPPFSPPTFRAVALPFFKKETIEGKPFKKRLKIDIYNKL
jgi:hypothetical protein